MRTKCAIIVYLYSWDEHVLHMSALLKGWARPQRVAGGGEEKGDKFEVRWRRTLILLEHRGSVRVLRL